MAVNYHWRIVPKSMYIHGYAYMHVYMYAYSNGGAEEVSEDCY